MLKKFLRSVIKRLVGGLREDPLEVAKKNGMQIGEGSIVHGGCLFGSEPYLISIGKRCDLSGSVVFITHDGAHWVFRNQEKYKNVKHFGRITIHDNCFIGWGATIMPGVTIGEGSIVCAQALVIQDVPPHTVVWGNPARPLMSTEAYAEKFLAKNTVVDEEAYRSDKKTELLRVLPRPW